MTSKTDLIARFGKHLTFREIEKISSGEAVSIRLRYQRGANTPAAAKLLVQHHVTLADAHRALTTMLEQGKVEVRVPVLSDFGTFKASLSAMRIDAEVV